MRATFKLINSYFWKTYYGPVISFFFPILLLSILGNIMRIEYVYPGIIALTMLFIGVLALPLAIMELKGSSLFKYIGSSPINKVKFSFVVVAYYIMVSVLTGFIIMFSAMIIFPKDVFKYGEFKLGILSGLSTVSGFFSFYAASFIHLILVIAVGLAIATFSKTPQQALTVAIIIIIPSMFLSGMVVTVDIIAKSRAMQWISRFVPFRYSTGNLIVATTPVPQLGDIFSHLDIASKEVIFGESAIAMNAGEINPFAVVESVGANAGFVRPNFNSKLLNTNDAFKNIFAAPWFSEWMKEWIQDPASVNTGALTGIVGKYLKTNKEVYDFMVGLQQLVKENTGFIINPKDMFEVLFRATDSSGINPSGDFFLMKTLLISPEALNNSDNNIFTLNTAWSVRMVVDTNSLKDFITNYFKSDAINTQRMGIILNNIQAGDFRFLEMFTKQTLELYTVADRSLNLLLPAVSSVGLGFYINKKFSWSNR